MSQPPALVLGQAYVIHNVQYKDKVIGVADDKFNVVSQDVHTPTQDSQKWIVGKVTDEYGSVFTTLQNVKTKKFLSVEVQKYTFVLMDEKYPWVVVPGNDHYRLHWKPSRDSDAELAGPQQAYKLQLGQYKGQNQQLWDFKGI